MSRAADKPTTKRWVYLSEVCQQPDWSEELLIDKIKKGSLPHRGNRYTIVDAPEGSYPQRDQIDLTQAPTIDCKTNTATWLTVADTSSGMTFDKHILTGIQVLIDVPEAAAAPIPSETAAAPFPPHVVLSTKKVLEDAARHFPHVRGEKLTGEKGYYKRLEKSDSRVANLDLNDRYGASLLREIGLINQAED